MSRPYQLTRGAVLTKILLVEDERKLAQVIAGELRAAGYDTRHAADGLVVA